MDVIDIFISQFTVAEKVNFFVAFGGFIVSVIVLYFTVKSWQLKHGQSVRASYGITITDKPYVSSVIIENLKDRDLVIFAIYLKFGSNVYLDLLDIDDSYDRYHHIIPSLSTRVFELGEPLYYTESSREVDMEDLLRNYRNGSIILLTNNGKIKAKKIKHGWNPIVQYFKNYGTCYVRPRRFYTKEAVPSSRQQRENYIDYSSYHKSVHYIVTLRFKDGNEYDFEIPPFYDYVPFSKLKFTPESLVSCESLKRFFLENRSSGNVDFEELVNIANVKQVIERNKKGIYSKEIEAVQSLNGFHYYIIWKLKTLFYKIQNPIFPSKLFSIYCKLGINNHPNNKKNPPNIDNNDKAMPKFKQKDKN